MSKILKVATLLFLCTVIGLNKVNAQGTPVPGGGGPGVNGGGGFTPPDNGGNADGAVPFDGGLSIILLAAGMGVAKRRSQNA